MMYFSLPIEQQCDWRTFLKLTESLPPVTLQCFLPVNVGWLGLKSEFQV